MATIRKHRDKWQAIVRRKGARHIARSFTKRADAVIWARQIETVAERRGLPVNIHLLDKMTVADVLKRYRDTVVPKKRSPEREVILLNAFLRTQIAGLRLSEATPSVFVEYRDQRLRHVKPATINRELGVLQHAFDIAWREWGLPVPENPLKRVRRPALPRGRDRRLEGDEEAHLYAACGALRGPYMRPLIILSLETAMRRGELLGLNWGDIDWEKRIVHLDITKNGDSRDVPLSLRAFETLERLRKGANGDRVFDVTGNAVRLAWGRLRRHAGCPDLHFHDLRHEAVSRLFEKGLDVIAVATISGHKELRMLKRYTHLRAEDLVDQL